MTKTPQQSPYYTPVQRVLIGFIQGYRRLLSPLIGHQCRFAPTCSHYGIEAITKHGALRGGALTIRRILKCHPFYRGRLIDPVPEKEPQSAGPTGTHDDLSV